MANQINEVAPNSNKDGSRTRIRQIEYQRC